MWNSRLEEQGGEEIEILHWRHFYCVHDLVLLGCLHTGNESG